MNVGSHCSLFVPIHRQNKKDGAGLLTKRLWISRNGSLVTAETHKRFCSSLSKAKGEERVYLFVLSFLILL